MSKVASISRESALHLVMEMKIAPTAQGMSSLYTTRAHDVLGYGTWRDFIESELWRPLMRLPDEDKVGIALHMRINGCSLRAIGAVTGWSHTKVQSRTRDVEPEGEDMVVGSDGVRYAVSRNKKSYRNQLLDTAWRARDAMEKLDKLVADERYNDERDKVGVQLESHVTAIIQRTDSIVNTTI